MDLYKQLAHTCTQLESHGMTERQIGCHKLMELIENKATVEFLNDAKCDMNWGRVLHSIQMCLKADGQKFAKDSGTKKMVGKRSIIPLLSADVFSNFLRLAIKQGADIKFSKPLTVMFSLLNDDIVTRQMFKSTFLRTIINCYLQNVNVRSCLRVVEWKEIFQLVKGSCDQLDTDPLKCLYLLLKYSPLYKCGIDYQNEFDFFRRLFLMVMRESLRADKEIILDVANELCRIMAKNNRSACCKLGEQVIQTFLELYQSGGDRLKIQIVTFCTLQLAIHNPKNCTREHPAFYAFDDNCWRHCLSYMFQLFTSEIESISTGQSVKPFVVSDEDGKEVSVTFLRLYVDVTRQLWGCSDFGLNSIDLNASDDYCTAIKQKRVAIDFDFLMKSIENTKSWVWVDTTCTFLKKYPELVDKNDIFKLSQQLCLLLEDCRDSNVKREVFKGLAIIDEISPSNEGISWPTVGKTAVMSMNSYRNDRHVNGLIQRLILKNVIDWESLYQNYRQQTVTRHNLITLNMALSFFTMVKYRNVSVDLLGWILNEHRLKDSPCFGDDLLAKFLVYLTLKQWPNDDNLTGIERESCSETIDLEDLLQITSLDKLIVVNRCDLTIVVGNDRNVTNYIDFDVFYHLMDLLDRFLIEDELKYDNIDWNLIKIVLVFKMLAYFIEFDLLQEESTRRLLRLFEICKKTFVSLCEFIAPLNRDISSRNMKRLIDLNRSLSKLFESHINTLLLTHLKLVIPEDLLKSMFEILQFDEEVKLESGSLLELKKTVIYSIMIFCDVPGETEMLPIQERALECLLGSEYNFLEDNDWKLAMTLLEVFSKCSKSSNFPQTILQMVYDLIQGMCQVRCHCSMSVEEILIAFQNIYPIIARCNHRKIKMSFVDFLHHFHDKKSNYGPDISIRLLKCMELLYELESDYDILKWQNEEIYLKYVPFLNSDLHELRLIAVGNIARFFHLSSQNTNIANFHRQEIIFSKLYDMSLNIFEIDSELHGERLIDETVTRSASVFHTFASIIVTSRVWMEEALGAMIKIAKTRSIVDYLKKIVSTIGKHLGYEHEGDLLKNCLKSLIRKWQLEGIDAFYYNLVDCKNKIEMYTTFWSLLGPFIVEFDANSLDDISRYMGKTTVDILKECAPELLSRCIATSIIHKCPIETIDSYRFLLESLQELAIRNIFVSKIDEIVICLLNFLYDNEDLKNRYGEMIFLKKNDLQLSITEFELAINFIQNMINVDDLILHLLNNHPEKIHEILLNLKILINGSKYFEEKLNNFHAFTLISILVLDRLEHVERVREYFVRDLIYTATNLINSYEDESKFGSCTIKFLNLMLDEILPKFGPIVGNFLLVIVTTLKNLSRKDINIDGIKNRLKLFENDGGDMIYTKYCFPNDRAEGNLELEMADFLRFEKNLENKENCEDALKHLRKVLTRDKDGLLLLLERVRSARKSDDCESRHFRELICTLVRLSSAGNNIVAFEAISCLGEIGPTDLASSVLEPEKSTIDSKWTPWELVSGQLIAILCKYIVDSNVNVMKTASDALCHVLNTKEGARVLASGDDFGQGKLNRNLVVPFLPTSRATSSPFSIVIDKFRVKIDSEQLWVAKIDHATWITSLVVEILSCFQDETYFRSLIKICELKVEFCEHLFPLVIYATIHTGNYSVCEIISCKMREFFMKHWEMIHDGWNECANITNDRKAVENMLDAVQFIRLQKCSKSKRKDNEVLLKLNYLHVAKAAQFCQLYFTALLYIEIWCHEQYTDIARCQMETDYSLSLLDLTYARLEDFTGKALHNILLQSYESIGECDAFLGCGSNFLLDREFRVQYHKRLGRWDDVIRYYETDQSASEHVSNSLIDALKQSNLYELGLITSQKLQQPDYESLWRLGRWDFDDDKNIDANGDFFEKCRFFALKSLNNADEQSFMRTMNRMTSSVIEQLKQVNLQSTNSFYKCLTNIQSLNEIGEFHKAGKGRDELELVFAKWKKQDEVTCNDFKFIEPIQWQRIVMIDGVLDNLNDNRSLQNCFIDLIVDFCEFSRLERHFNVAHRALTRLERFSLNLSDDIKARIDIEDAQLCWAKGDLLTAKCILRRLCSNENISPRLHASALKMTGKWLAEESSENRQVIIKEYFLKSLSCLDKNDNSKANIECIMNTYVQLAKFADEQYQQTMAHIKSDLFQKKIKNMEKSKQTVKTVSANQHKDSMSKDLKKAIAISEGQSSIDQTEIRTVESEKNNLLKTALKYYLKSLIIGDLDNINIFRTVSLFLDNRDNQLLDSMVKGNFLEIPTYKFIDVLPQIIPHIVSTTNNDLFSQIITKIVEKCAKDHPHHTLPLLLALADANKDARYSADCKKSFKESRALSATNVLKKLCEDVNLKGILKEMEALSDALIELAYYKGSPKEEMEIKIPAKCKIGKIRNFDKILLPTHHLQVSKSCNYDNLIGIRSYDGGYYNVGGINAPKRIICRGTDGLERTQLIKGQDDLRQDAVMQQVFTIINNLLRANKQTKYLLIRTYKIVPLSMKSGVLEWVSNTMPIGEFLAGKHGDGGAHALYNPTDRLSKRCRADLKRACDKTADEKLKVYTDICRNFKPVFHKFFETRFPSPTIWYEKRRAYIYSVATTSMCGYILGIGDRHVNNILIDNNTAEVIHIDFGIAFEQGRVLPTPETVPFRLSRDIVDGMGIAGVEGLFRKSCEKTMEVLRNNNQLIVTILEVLLYDPLYDWTVSTAEANKRQHVYENGNHSQFSEQDLNNINVTAERALLRLKAKLQGTENGNPLTVTHQVGTLIQKAQDPMNLCRLFNGWQPYL